MSWQHNIAHNHIVPSYQAIGELVAMIMVGSVPRSLHNEYSDLDLIVYWSEIPPEASREHAIAALGGALHEIGDSSEGETDLALQSQAEVFYLFGDRHTGLKVDVTHKTVASADQMIEDVVVQHDTKTIKIAIIHGLQNSETVYGDTWINERKQRIGQRMPIALSEALIKEHMHFKPLWIYDQFALRADPLHYHINRLYNLDKMLRVLGAVNRLYLPYEFKHLSAFINAVRLKPTDLEQIVFNILDAPPQKAKLMMQTLGDNVYLLVETHFQHINTQEAKSFFHYLRPKLSQYINHMNISENFTINKETISNA